MSGWAGRMLLGVIGIALIVRIAYLALAGVVQLDTAFYANDSTLYEAMARDLLDGRGLILNGRPTAFVGPGYPVFLAGVFTLFGSSIEVVGIVQAVLGAVTAGLIGRIAARLATPLAGWVAGLLAAFYPHLIFWTGHLLTETLFVFLAVGGLWLLVEGSVRRDWRWFAAAGLTLAAGALTRPVLLAYIPVAAGLAWRLGDGAGSFSKLRTRPTPLGGETAERMEPSVWLAEREQGRRWERAAAVLLAAGVLIGPWTVRNALVVGVATPVSTESTFVMWQGNSPGATGGTRGYVDGMDFQRLPLPPGTTEAEQYRMYGEAVRAYLLAEPLSIVQRMPAKLWNMWRPVYESASLRNWIVSGGSYLALMALALAGAAVTLRGSPSGIRYVQSYVLTLTALHMVVTGMIRFRLPIEAALAVLAGIGVARWIESLAARGKLVRPRIRDRFRQEAV